MSPLRATGAAVMAGAVLLLPTSASDAQPARPVINITLTSHHYHPNPIYLPGGVPVRMIFINRARKSHDFKAPAFFRSARMIRGAAPNGVISLRGGRGTVVDLIPARGRYPVHCTQPFHSMLGMTGWIVVG